MNTKITYQKSIEIIKQLNIEPTILKDIFISDTLGQVIAQDIVANENSPQFITSAMDGYAVKHTDIELGQLKIIGTNPAGSVCQDIVLSNTCIKTFTGSLMPKGSDTLIPIENISLKDGFIIIDSAVPKYFATRDIGENYKKGEVLIKSGTKIDFAHIGVMASMNISRINIYKSPVISIASTGSEILDLDEPRTNDSQIRSSNHITLEAMGKKYGADIKQLGVVKDDKDSISKLLSNALVDSDIVVTTGGVSVGDYDFVKDIIKDELECEVLFQGVLIKPGQHIIVAKKDNKLIVGLPGFAYSSTVTFLLYVVPLVLKFKTQMPILKTIDAHMLCDFPKKTSKTVFTACNLTYKNSKYLVDMYNKKNGTSAILTNMLGSNTALLIQDNNSKDLKINDMVKVICLNNI